MITTSVAGAPTKELCLLLLGSGGREHALALRLLKASGVTKIYCIPGNAGTASLEKVQNVSDVSPADYRAVTSFARKYGVSMVIPGSEGPLVEGIESFCRERGLQCFGPTSDAAILEGSKVFAKDFMKTHGIPTAAYETFTHYDNAKANLNAISHDVVIKASGLAGGKGVVIPRTKEEAHEVLEKFMLKDALGKAGKEIVIEEFLKGEELSFLSFTDGHTLRTLPPGQDHKQAYDGDEGPNTGGMGVYAPSALATNELVEEVHRTILQPTIDAMRKQGTPMKGLLFTGIMVTANGPKVLEYNVRFGDPECQSMLPLLSEDTDLLTLMTACCEGWLDSPRALMRTTNDHCATVVACSGGYPNRYETGHEITFNAPSPSNCTIIHAGTSIQNGKLVTSGGRVIAATGTGPTLDAALTTAYKGISTITFKGMHYRRDIGRRPSTLPPAPQTSAPLSYAAAGVSISSGNALVKAIAPLVASTARPGTTASIGGFGGTFSLPSANYPSSPLLIGAIDGVGTKLKLAHQMNKHDTVGIDLVAMNVNDLLVQGAEPLFFLDCYTCGTLDIPTATAFVSGVVQGCKLANCALIGGETAEMPGLFTSSGRFPEDGGLYDAVGAAVGAMPQTRPPLPRKADMLPGDVLLALPSSGAHSNGFSLIRAILARAALPLTALAPWDPSTTVGASLLTPTKIYVKPLLPIADKGLIKGMAHITGGGLTENIPRMLPTHLAAKVDVGRYPLPPVFRWLKAKGGLVDEEFARAFNTGVGMMLCVAEGMKGAVVRMLEEGGEVVCEIGVLVERGKGEGCVLTGLEAWA